MKTVAIVLARNDSRRLPLKHFKIISEVPLLEFIFERLKASANIDEIVLATSDRKIDDSLASAAMNIGYSTMRGEFEDVLSRFLNAAEIFHADTVVKVNGDSPLISAEVIDVMLEQLDFDKYPFITAKAKHCGLPIGIGAEIITSDALRELSLKSPQCHRESITGYIFDEYNDLSYTAVPVKLKLEHDYSEVDLTVDDIVDLDRVNAVCERLKQFTPSEIRLKSLLNLINELRNENEI